MQNILGQIRNNWFILMEFGCDIGENEEIRKCYDATDINKMF